MDTTNPASDSEYLGITEAADYLRVSASTLRRWEKKGFLVPERTPTGIRRYTKKQLDDVIQTPAYEKPAVSTPVVEHIAQTAAPIDTRPIEINHLEPEPTPAPSYQVEETVDEYIHVIEPDAEETLAQHTIDSQVDARPASFTSAHIDHGYTPLDYAAKEPIKEADPFESFSYTKNNQTETSAPIKSVAPDNFATVEQQQFNHIFDIHENENMDEQVELEEYDTDAAYVSDDPRTSTYSYGATSQETVAPKQKKKQTWVKPVFLFISLFLAIVIISMVAWFALSSTTVSGAPLNPVIE